MTLPKTSHDGYLMVDHRASPGIPEDMALRMGLDPATAKGGKLAEYATTGCRHCGVHVIFNPLRTRDRAWCSICDRYICDFCDAARTEPGYEHHCFDELRDMVQSEKFTVVGHASRPLILPK